MICIIIPLVLFVSLFTCNRSYILKGEDLWKTVIKSWNEMLEEVLVRTYQMHHQIVNEIIKHKGKNDF